MLRVGEGARADQRATGEEEQQAHAGSER
jgi:hypothetical protein